MQKIEWGENLNLDVLGLLRTGNKDPRTTYLTEEEKQIVAMVGLAGADGLHKRQTKGMDPVLLDVLEAHGLLKWERDLRGRPMFLCLTWKGEDIAVLLVKQAKSESHRISA
jgi:hypothetical protein